MTVGRMLLASAAAGIAATWPVSMFFAVSWLQGARPVEGGAAMIPFMAPLAGIVCGVALGLPYALLRRAKGWGFVNDLIVHAVIACSLTTMIVLKVAESVDTSADLFVRIVGACLAVTFVTSPAPLVFAAILRRQHSRLQEG